MTTVSWYPAVVALISALVAAATAQAVGHRYALVRELAAEAQRLRMVTFEKVRVGMARIEDLLGLADHVVAMRRAPRCARTGSENGY